MSRLLAVGASLTVLLLLLTLAAPAAAHERRTVGPYQLVIGWLNEPAFAGEPNSLDLRISDTRVAPAKAVEGLEKTLKIEILYGGLASGFSPAISARFGTPGAYNAYIVPTKDGAYRFHLTGKIEALDVDQTFESGPGRFNDVQPLSAISYPAAGAAASEGPRLYDLAAVAGVVLGLASLGLTLSRRRA